MSEANIALLRRAWTAYNQGDEEEFAACLTPDWKEYGSPDATEYGTLENERRTMREHRIAFPDKHAEIHMILADENSVACFLTVRATHTGKYLGVEPTGKTVVSFSPFESGFTALSQFYVQFREAYGVTPRQMRANLVHG